MNLSTAMSKSSKTEIEGLTLAITRLCAAGKSSQEIQNYFECEMLLDGASPPSMESTSARPVKRKRRKNLKEGILNFLASQGKKGAHVKVIADSVRSKPANITAWIFSTGKKVKGLKKVKPATYAYVGE
jgi:hypothetical protein